MLRVIVIALLAVILTSRIYIQSHGKQFAYFSDIAYEPLQSIASWSCSLCGVYPDIKEVTTFAVGDMQGFVGYYPSLNAGSVVVAFRGSTNIDNWIKNLKFIWTDYDLCRGCKVHQGFYQYTNNTLLTVKGLVNTLLQKYSRSWVYIMGHSLGGAVALITGLQLSRDLSNTICVYTYGQPRIGNLALANYIEQDFDLVFRVIHYADMVPHVMPMNVGYRHGGQEVWYNGDMNHFVECDPQDDRCSNSLSFYSISDHSIDQYYIQIRMGYLESVKGVFQNVLKAIGVYGPIYNEAGVNQSLTSA